ncbi:MAG: hypothetical protein R3213_04245 [Flavobacteriaceae bacterium]|nr:hypothetical protein [Flavobacteriaceae bacterium]
MIKPYFGKICFFVLLGVIPVLFREVFGASSLALGLAVFLSLLVLTNARYFKKAQIYRFSEILILWVFLLHVILSMFGGVDSKPLLSFVFVLFVILASRVFAERLLSNWNLEYGFFKAIFFFLFALLLFAIATDYHFSGYFYDRAKGIFPFGEPSNYALFFGPFFLAFVVFVDGFWKKMFVIAFVGGGAFYVQSTTLMVYVFLAAALLFKFNIGFILCGLPALAIGGGGVLLDPYFSSRVIITPETNNLSALVYLQGLSDAYNSLLQSHGFGIGFQMLGTQPPSEFFFKIQSILGQDSNGTGLNREDGGFLAAKIIAEFGVLGIALILSYIFLFIHSFLRLRSLVRKPVMTISPHHFALVFSYAFFVEVFVRGTGYFSPTLFLFLVSLFILSRDKVGGLKFQVQRY